MLVPAIVAGTLVSAASVVGLTTLSTHRAEGPDELRVPCGAVWDRLPAELRDDLQGVKDLPDAEKPAALRAIREGAVAGEYGDRVARGAERMQDRRERLLGRLPEELRADLEELRTLPDDEKVAAAQELRDGALAGAYGDQVQELAGRLQDRREACAS